MRFGFSRCETAMRSSEIWNAQRGRDRVSEDWRAVVGFEGSYEVSNLGRVRSLDRTRIYQRFDQGAKRMVTVTRLHKGHVLRPGTTKSGHQLVVLKRGSGGQYVHSLVLAAFVGPRPDGSECCHGDGDPTNNRVENLRWDTRLANVQDMIRHGTAQWLKEART